MHKPKIAVIIVGYKSRDDLPDLFSSLLKSSYAQFQAYFLENGVDDGSADYVERGHGTVRVMRSRENLGFAAGNNYVIDAALRESGDYDALLLLDPDMVVDSECLTHLAAAYAPDRIVQPLVLLHKDSSATDTINTMGNPLHYLGFSYAGGNGESRSTAGNEPYAVALASGAAMLVPVTLWQQLRGFDQRFFMYHEDADLSLRSRLLGADILCQPRAVAWHKYSFSRNKLKFYYFERNRILTIFKNYQAVTLVSLAPMFLVTEIAMVLYSLMGGWFGLKLKSSLDAAAMLATSRTMRKNVQRMRAIPDKKLFPLLSPTLKFSEVDGLAVRAYNLVSSLYWKLIFRP